MKIAVSACLLGENCKYSGGNNRNEAVLRFLEGHEVIPVCPEVLGGLPVPRESAEIVNGTVRVASGRSVDKEFRLGAEKALETVLARGAELAVLQSRSPSCGVNEVYDGTFSRVRVPGQGVFAALLIAHGIKVIDSADCQ